MRKGRKRKMLGPRMWGSKERWETVKGTQNTPERGKEKNGNTDLFSVNCVPRSSRKINNLGAYLCISCGQYMYSTDRKTQGAFLESTQTAIPFDPER
jgi:hypothetical protein